MVPSLTDVAFYSSIIVLYFLVTVAADTSIILSILVLTYLQFLICFMLFLALLFVDELPHQDLDVCVSTGVSPVSTIGNSYTLITIIFIKKKKNSANRQQIERTSK